MTTYQERFEELSRTLHSLASDVIEEVTQAPDGIREGTVLTPGPPAYRRIDCDGRALAYVRARPRKNAVRIDVSGLWSVARDTPLQVRGATGSKTLLVRTPHDVPEAVTYLRETVARTRERAQPARGGGRKYPLTR